MDISAQTAMEDLIKEIRGNVPFHISFEGSCEGRCDVCADKLIEFLDIEVSHWESRMAHHVFPGMIDVENLGKDYRKVHAILKKQGITQ